MTRIALVVLIAGTASVGSAQERLSLPQAVERARVANPMGSAARAAEREAEARLRQAQAGYLPRVDFAESWQRGNLPVYVFGSLLSQRRFTEAGFAVDALNHPDPLANFRAALTFQHALFSPEVRTGVRAADLARELAGVGREGVDLDLAVEATRAFGDALRAQVGQRVAAAAVEAAEEDLRRARDRRDAGLVTEADVLAIEVHLAQMKARGIDAESQARVAAANLNRVMGEPLDRAFDLEAAPQPAPPARPLAELEAEALRARPEARRAQLGERVAGVQQSGAKQAFLPQIGWQGGYEWNGGDFGDRAGGWMVGAEVRINLFRGFADKARLAEAMRAVDRARAERQAAEAGIRLDVRRAYHRLEAARARLTVGTAAVAQARESQRIIRDRYENGLAGINDVLRAALALVDAEAQQTTAQTDTIVETAALERAVGRAW